MDRKCRCPGCTSESGDDVLCGFCESAQPLNGHGVCVLHALTAPRAASVAGALPPADAPSVPATPATLGDHLSNALDNVLDDLPMDAIYGAVRREAAKHVGERGVQFLERRAMKPRDGG